MKRRTPFFSIIIPVFNRASTIGRCLESLAIQRFDDFEVIIVDDGSTDDTLAVVHAHRSERVFVLAHAENRGVGPARNTGIDRSRGRWLVFLDSDDALAGPNALALMALRALEAQPDDHALWFRCRLDNGKLTPDPMPAERVWDYEAYLRFLEATHGRSRDMIRCVRSTCFFEIQYPETRMLEEKFHLDFARRFRSRIHDDVLRLYHQDAPSRLSEKERSLDPHLDFEFIRDRAAGFADLIEAHGEALARVAPRVYRLTLARAVRAALRAGRARSAFSQAGTFFLRAPLDPRADYLLARAAWARFRTDESRPQIDMRLRALALAHGGR